MTKKELRELVEEPTHFGGCGCCGDYEEQKKSIEEAVEKIWNEIKPKRRRRIG